MKSKQYLSLDCEMGGRDLNYSLLTLAFVVLNEEFEEIDHLHLKLKPDDGVYVVSAQGMAVNKINIVEHDKTAKSYREGGRDVFDFLKKASDAGSNKLVPLGHGVRGDIEFVLKYLLSRGSWDVVCKYHYVDTSVVLQFLRACGKLKDDEDGSVESLCKQLNIFVKPDSLHDALQDARMVGRIYARMVELI